MPALLYNFNAGEVVGGMVIDQSGNGINGLFGVGFPGSTAPVVIPEPGTAVWFVSLLALGAALVRRCRS